MIVYVCCPQQSWAVYRYTGTGTCQHCMKSAGMLFTTLKDLHTFVSYCAFSHVCFLQHVCVDRSLLSCVILFVTLCRLAQTQFSYVPYSGPARYLPAVFIRIYYFAHIALPCLIQLWYILKALAFLQGNSASRPPDHERTCPTAVCWF